MRLQDSDDPIQVWQYAERYLGGGTRTYSRFSADLEISRRYHPQWGQDSFLLPTFRVPEGVGTYLRSGLPSRLHELYHGDGWVLLPVHPDTWQVAQLPSRAGLAACEAGPSLQVVPMANARTVLVRRVGGQAVAPHFLKLHYPRRLSRFGRRLRRPMIELQLWVAAELARAGVPFLPEVGGGVVGDDPTEAWGYLIRECELTGAPRLPFTVPLFGLYGRDVRAGGDPTLLEQLVARSGVAAAEFLAQRVVAPMVRLWWQILTRTGCLAEMHGQNTLFTFSASGASGVGYRDCGIYVDPGVRALRGLTGQLPPRNVISVDVKVPAPQIMSLAYDTFMGNHALSYLAELAQERLGVPVAVLHRTARQTFSQLADEAISLPATTFNYDDQLHPDGEWHLVDTGNRPLWR